METLDTSISSSLFEETLVLNGWSLSKARLESLTKIIWVMLILRTYKRSFQQNYTQLFKSAAKQNAKLEMNGFKLLISTTAYLKLLNSIQASLWKNGQSITGMCQLVSKVMHTSLVWWDPCGDLIANKLNLTKSVLQKTLSNSMLHHMAPIR